MQEYNYVPWNISIQTSGGLQFIIIYILYSDVRLLQHFLLFFTLVLQVGDMIIALRNDIWR
jgi:hypothetical protein